MFYTSIFLTFDRDEMYRKVFYTFNFLERKISLTSKMFYFIYPPVVRKTGPESRPSKKDYGSTNRRRLNGSV